jgi:glycine cleavage system pyridoxal-binding protein P
MRSSNETLAAAMAELANTIHSPDGVANAAIREAGERITELAERLETDGIHSCHQHCQRTACVLRRKVEKAEGLNVAFHMRIRRLESIIREIDATSDILPENADHEGREESDPKFNKGAESRPSP